MFVEAALCQNLKQLSKQAFQGRHFNITSAFEGSRTTCTGESSPTVSKRAFIDDRGSDVTISVRIEDVEAIVKRRYGLMTNGLIYTALPLLSVSF